MLNNYLDKEIDKCVYRLFDDGYHMMCVTDKNILSAYIPDEIDGISVTSVGAESILEVKRPGFWECKKLTTIKLPSNLHVVGGFEQCESIKEIVIPNTCKKITYSAFQYCTNLETIVLPMGLEIIEGSVFNGCFKLKSLNIPDNVKILEEECFAYSNFEYIKLPSKLKQLSNRMFMYCENIKEIIFPLSLKKGEINRNIFFDDNTKEFKESFIKMMKSLKAVRVAKQNEAEARKLFEQYDVVVQVL